MAVKQTQEIQRLVAAFADAVIGQTEAIGQGDHRTGNRSAKRYIAAFRKLRILGDAGRDGLVTLLVHSSSDVRTMAACYLLRYRTREALEVLRAAAAGEGLIAFEASEAIKRWEEGTWNLDPGGLHGTHG